MTVCGQGKVLACVARHSEQERRMVRHICCDPYKKHKCQVSKNLRIVSESLADLVQDKRVEKGALLCMGCRVRLTKDPRSLPREETVSATCVEDTSGSGTENSSEISEPACDLSKEDTGRVLPMLGISPLRTSE